MTLSDINGDIQATNADDMAVALPDGQTMAVSNGCDIINLHEVPISVIGSKCRTLLCQQLNNIKVILSEDGLPRDWRGVLHCINLANANTAHFITKADPFGAVLDCWIREQRDLATMGMLHHILGKIDRWDVVDDSRDSFVEAAKAYLTNRLRQEQQQQQQQQQQHQYYAHTDQPDANACDSRLYTIDDSINAQQGLPPQRYDAFLLFADENIEFATEILERMEAEGFKLFVKERDLIGGAFEHKSIMEIIQERCERLIVVLSPAFLKSPANTFFVDYAQAIGIHKSQRTIIPCIYDECKLPANLAYLCALRFRKINVYYNFWSKLSESLRTVPSAICNGPPSITITQYEAPAAAPARIAATPQPQQAIEQPAFGRSSSLGKAQKRQKEKSGLTALLLQDSGSIKSKGLKQSASTGLKRFWPPSPKMRTSAVSSSLWTLAVDTLPLDKENERCHSTISLNSPSSSPTTLQYKKPKWYKKLLSPNTASATIKLSTESDSTDVSSIDKSRKKKKWYRKRFSSKTRTKAYEI